MANGHSPNTPKGQGGMAQPNTQKPRTSTNTNTQPKRVKPTQGKHTPGK